jgi:hypothetical protein
MNEFIDKATPLVLALFLSFIGIIATIVSEASEIAFSFDIWVLTTLFAADSNAIKFYNLTGKSNSIMIIVLVHLSLYVFVLGWLWWSVSIVSETDVAKRNARARSLINSALAPNVCLVVRL